MAKTVVILGKSAAVVASIREFPALDGPDHKVRAALAQHTVQAAFPGTSGNLEASRLRAAGFTEKEIEEIGFALLGSLGTRHDA